MLRKLIGYSVLAILLLSTVVPISPLAEETSWWDINWSFKDEVLIPINTSDDLAKFQPMDFSFKFNNSCWALNEDEHSVRVILEEDGRFQPLECQIYDLKHVDDEYIESCSIIFLIPEEATGKECYFIYYDDDEQLSPNYPNRVDIIEDEYRFEKIPGLPFQSSYYGISQEGYIVYGVSKSGTAIGEHLTQQVAKLKEGTETVMPNKVEIGASFHFEYWWDDNGWKSIKTTDKIVSHQKIVDGNLMLKFGIVSESEDGELRSTVIYKYYYCPTEDKRLHTHVKHEVLEYPLYIGQETDVAFITFVNNDLRSNTIEELNFGGIFPYLHFYNEKDMIQTFEMDQHPDSKGALEISKTDDYDLGSSAWLSLDEGASGKAHGIIFESNKVIKYGPDEYEGIELQLWEIKSPQLPGLEGNTAFLYIMKNAYEEEGRDDGFWAGSLSVFEKAERKGVTHIASAFGRSSRIQKTSTDRDSNIQQVVAQLNKERSKVQPTQIKELQSIKTKENVNICVSELRKGILICPKVNKPIRPLKCLGCLKKNCSYFNSHKQTLKSFKLEDKDILEELEDDKKKIISDFHKNYADTE